MKNCQMLQALQVFQYPHRRSSSWVVYLLGLAGNRLGTLGSGSQVPRSPSYSQEGKWEEALEQYTYGLEIENIPPDQKGLLLSNRLGMAGDGDGEPGRW